MEASIYIICTENVNKQNQRMNNLNFYYSFSFYFYCFEYFSIYYFIIHIIHIFLLSLDIKSKIHYDMKICWARKICLYTLTCFLQCFKNIFDWLLPFFIYYAEPCRWDYIWNFIWAMNKRKMQNNKCSSFKFLLYTVKK